MTLEQAARDLLAHWDTISWTNAKMTADYIANLRKALTQPQPLSKMVPVGEVNESAEIDWYEGISDYQAPEGSVLYVKEAS